MNKRHFVFLPGTHVPPSIFEEIQLPSESSSALVDWMKYTDPCSINNAVSLVTQQVGAEAGVPTILVGHSSGAVIAAMTALSEACRVSGLVLINSGPNMKKHRSIDTLLHRLSGPLRDNDWKEFAESNTSIACPVEHIHQMLEYSKQIGGAPAANFLREQFRLDLLEFDPRPGLPVEVLHGSLDKKRGISDALLWKSVFPDANIQIDRTCGHTPPLENPESVRTALARISLCVA